MVDLKICGLEWKWSETGESSRLVRWRTIHASASRSWSGSTCKEVCALGTKQNSNIICMLFSQKIGNIWYTSIANELVDSVQKNIQCWKLCWKSVNYYFCMATPLLMQSEAPFHDKNKVKVVVSSLRSWASPCSAEICALHFQKKSSVRHGVL
jgi:hypothetical protein